jgi:uncharacterized protein (TIGR01777 family)
MKKEKANLIIAGGTGYLGSLIADHFKKDYTITILTRKNTENRQNIKYINWKDNWEKVIDNKTIIINLTGKSINCLFTEKNKKELINSRLIATKLINQAIAKSKTPPKLFINASGISIYKETYQAKYDEYNYEYGKDFLSTLSQQWEKEFYKAKTPNTRKVAIRLAPVLGKNSSAIKTLIPVVKLGLGGKQGSGKQLFPFIHQTDFLKAIAFIIQNKQIDGSINFIAPTPTNNQLFMKTFRTLLKVKIGIPTPAFLLAISKYFTKVEPEIILTSLYAKPTKLIENKFEFTYPTIKIALNEILLKP